MSKDPVIITGSLSNEELEKSINQLVTNVKKGAKEMADAFDSEINRMKASLQSLGKQNVTMPTVKLKTESSDRAKTAAAGSYKGLKTQLERALRMPEDSLERINKKIWSLQMSFDRLNKMDILSPSKIASTEAAISKLKDKASEMANKVASDNRKVTETFDAQAQAIKKATGQPKSARESYYAFFEGYRAQAHEIQRMMAEEQKASRQNRQNIVDDFSKTIEQRKARVKELSEEIAKLYKERPDAYRATINQKREEMNVLKRKIRELSDAQKNLIESPVGASNRYLDLEKEYYRIKNIMIDTTNTRRQSAQEVQTEAKEVKKLTDEEQRAAEAAKAHAERVKEYASAARAEFAEGKSYHLGARLPYEQGLVYPQNDTRAKGLSIEQQIEQILQKEAESYNRIDASVSSVAQKEERRLKKYTAPDAWKGVDIDTRSIVASKLQIDKGSVINYDEQTSSLRQLSAAVKQYQSAYERMSSAERKSPFGQQLLQDIQVLQRTIRQTRQEMSRPISLDGLMSQPARTLDEMAEKLRQLQSYKRGINLTDPKQAAEIRQVDTEINRITIDMNKYMTQTQGVINQNNALTRSWNYMKNRLAFYFTVGASTSFVKSLIDVRGQYEMTEKALGVLIGSAEYGTKIFNELSNMALISPYTLIELSGAARQLTAYGVAAEEVVDTTRRMADMAAAVGVPMERLTYALGQVKAYGYLNSRDARMFANAGIPLVKDLAATYSELEGRIVSVSDVYDRIKHKAVSYNDVMMSVQKMTDAGGRYFDFQAKMADTLKVQLANLTLAWNNMLNDIGKSNQGLISLPIQGLKELMVHWKEIERRINSLIILYGVYRAKNLMLNTAIGSQVSTVNRQILADKQLEASRLRREAFTRKLTAAEKQLVASSNKITAADYRQVLSTKNLTAEKAKLLIFFNRYNKEMVLALQQMFNLTAAEVRAARGLQGLKLAWSAMGMAAKAAGLMIKAAFSALWPMLLIGAIFEVINRFHDAREAAKEFNDALRESGKNKFEEVGKFIEQYAEQLRTLRTPITKEADGKSVVTGYENLSNKDAENLWVELKEQITLSSSAAEYFITKLMAIKDVNDRLRAGFSYLEDIQKASAAMQNLEEGTIKGEDSLSKMGSKMQNAWQSTYATLDQIEKKYGSLEKAEKDYQEVKEKYDKAIKGSYQDDYSVQDPDTHLWKLYITQLELAKKKTEDAREETDKFAKSFVNFAANASLGMSATIEALQQFEDQKDQRENRSLKESTSERIAAEIAVADERIKLINQQIESEKRERISASNDTERALIDNRIRSLEQERAEWQTHLTGEQGTFRGFTRWLTQFYGAEMRRMFANKSQAELENLDWSKKENAEWAESLARKFAKEYGISFDTLWDYIRRTNDMSIFIKMTISTEDQNSVYDTLTKLDQDADTAYNTIKRLDERIKQLQKKGTKDVPMVSLDAPNATDDEKELVKALTEKRRAQEDYNKAVAAGGRSKKEDRANAADERKRAADERKRAAAARREQNEAESELQKALKEELQLIEKVRGAYKDLTKEGASRPVAIEKATTGFEESVTNINKTLGKFGIAKLDLKKFAGITNPMELVNLLQEQLNKLLKTGAAKPAEIQALQVEIQKITLEADKYDLTMITKGLNNELDKLKDEYELAVAFDADPELGNAFADMMGINIDTLPHTVKEYADRYTTYLNKYLKGKESNLQFKEGELFGLTRDDITAFQEQVNAGTFNQEWFDEIKKAFDAISSMRKKDLEDTTKWKNGLIEKYGGLQAKLTKIYKDSIQQQVDAVKAFGTDEQESNIIRLQMRLEATDNPAELAVINQQIAAIVKDVTDKNPIALKLVHASGKEVESKTAKAYWEDFKDSDLYTMTFEDMANNSTRAIQLIMEKLEALKDKVKEDPASMKALMKSLEDAEKELNTRDPFGGVARSLKAMAEASKEAKDAQEALRRAEDDVEQAQQAVDDSEDASPEEQAAAQDKLAAAIQRRKTAQEQLTKAENKEQKAQKNLKASLEGISSQLGNVKELFNTVSSLFRAGGDDETADAIDAISEGFSVMTTVIMGVIAALVLLEASNPWLLAIAAALSVIVGLVSFLSGSKDKKLTKQIKESERAVKRLENTYKKLHHTTENALGAEEIAARRAEIANKQQQLSEKQRELALEKSRKAKSRDKDRIIEIRGEIIDLENEINDLKNDVVTSLLGSDIKSAAEDFVDTWVAAWRAGENTLDAMNEKMDEMIFNLIKKAMASKIVSTILEPLYKELDRMTSDGSQGGTTLTLNELRQLAEMTGPIAKDINIALGTFFENLKSLDVVSKNKDKELSALQQGLQSMSETTAEALEAYANSISQQVFYQSSLMEQIRDAIVSFNMDVSLGVQSQMLLQLQSSYQTQQAIQQILEGVLVPSGRAFAVELLS